MIHQVLVVTWVDSRWSSSSWTSPEDFRAFMPATVVSVGLGYEFEDKVVLASDYYPASIGQDEGYRYTSVIPKECIKKIERKD